MLLGQSVMHVQQSVKSVRRRAKHTLKGFKDMSAVLKHTDHEDIVVSQDSHMLYLLR